ncbi:hypothetical protein CIB48_g8366 [Xylaria polymorpha]|nr:hypothetical protein CIB48_g8366 [Xylaria polymorpha]
MLLSNSVIWRVFALLGALFSVLATEAVAFPSSNATHATGGVAVNTANPIRDSGQVLTIPLKRVNHRGITTPSILKRFFKTEVFGVYGAAYLAELTIGTSTDGSQQVIDVLIDTGSFELWVNPNCSASSIPDFCEAFGHYNPALSSTSQKVNNDGFSIKYGSGRVMGPYYKDDIYISGVRIQDQQFGVANSSELVWFGIMGLGHGQGNGFINYPLVIDSLAAQGLTNTKLFSMDLGRQVSPGAVITGEMTFGGVNTNSYAGMLKKVPTIHLIHSSLPLPLIVDSGTTLSLLPEPLVSKLAAQFPGAKSDGAGGYRVDCAYQNQTGTVDFEFLAADGPVTINVAYSDFIWKSGGDCFLVAFDQTNNALFMSNRLSCGDGESNLVVVPAGPDAAANIPGSCATVAALPSAPTGTLVSSSMLPTVTVSSTAIPLVTSTIGLSLNPVGPANTTTVSTPSASHTSSPVSPLPSIDTNAPGPGTGAGADPNASLTVNGATALGDSTLTVTGTITRTVVYTVAAACPETVRDCPLRSKVATRFETIVTTYCPSHDEEPSITAVGEVTFVTEPSALIITPAVVETSIPPIVGIGTSAGAGFGDTKSSDELGQGQTEESQITVITIAYPMTTTYAVTSCSPGDAACTVNTTTTRAITTTIVKTIHVEPIPTSVPPGNGFAPAVSGGNNNSTRNSGGGRGPAVVAISAAPDTISGTRYLAAALVLVWGVATAL